ncbi:substrate-binding periplasmic protein [Pseudomonas sp. EL_65y_Pfl2_R95]|uniref:substrate-binding periplasmic protein n=1 Tax=Pseudomonas sp. EL_65y_Pfl2_R95 TaxID=3088698 RepID=UPI0030D975BC
MRYLCIGLLLCLSLPASAESLLAVADEQFAPYSFSKANSEKPIGMDVDLISAILHEAKLDFQIRLYPWQRVKQMLDQHDADLAFAFAGTAERKQQYRLVGPLRTGATVFMTTHKTAITDWQSLDDLMPYVIGQVRGYAYETNFDHADLSRDSSAQNPRQLVSMLLAGRIDIIIGDKTQLMYFVHEQNSASKVRVLPHVLVDMPRYAAFNKNDEKNAQAFASALQRLKDNGKLQAIYQQWQY